MEFRAARQRVRASSTNKLADHSSSSPTEPNVLPLSTLAWFVFTVMFAAATSFFSGTNISRSYNIGPNAFTTATSIASGFGSTAAAALTGSRSSTPGPSSSSHATGSNGSTPAAGGSAGAGTTATGSLPTTPPPPTFHVGLWRVQSATHKVTHKRVSVWTFDRRSEGERLGVSAKERVLEVLKAEVNCDAR